MAFSKKSNFSNGNQKLYGIAPNSYRDNRFPDSYSRYRFYSSEKRPLSLKTQKLIEPVYCAQCGTQISSVNNIHECAACETPICSACNNAGLCDKHFDKLDKKEKKLLKKNSKRKIKQPFTYFYWAILGMLMLMGSFLGGFISRNYMSFAFTMPMSVFFLVGFPFLLYRRNKKKEKENRKKIVPILSRLNPNFKKNPTNYGMQQGFYKANRGTQTGNTMKNPQNNQTFIPNQNPIQKDKQLLEKFKKVLKVSNKIKQKQVAEFLEISEKELLKKLFEWGEILPFKIDDDLIVVEDMDDFVDQLDKQFEDWEDKEITKEGKI